MPSYLYTCSTCKALKSCAHGMHDEPTIYCPFCGSPMHKKPQAVRVVWNGNKPSDGGVTDYVTALEADAPRRRDKIQEYKETKDASDV